MLKPHPPGEVVHGTGGSEVIHFNFLHIGTRGALGDNGVGDEASKYFLVVVESKCLLVVVEDVNSYT